MSIIIVAIVVLLYAMLFYFRQVQNVKCAFPTVGEARHGVLWVFCTLVVIFLFVIPLGFVLPTPSGRPFLVLSEQLKNTHGASFFVGFISALFTKKNATYFLTTLVFVALPEEFIFRATIQNMIARLTNNPMLALMSTSILFGAVHLANGALGWSPVDWNWTFMLLATIAGVGYGLVFMKTSSIMFPVMLHALVVLIWRTCLSG